MIFVVYYGEYEDRRAVGYSESQEEATAFAREESRKTYEESCQRWASQQSEGKTVPRHIRPFNEIDGSDWAFYVEPLERIGSDV